MRKPILIIICLVASLFFQSEAVTAVGLHQLTTISIPVQSVQPLYDAIVEVEIYDQDNQRVHQQTFDQQTITKSPVTFSIIKTFDRASTYRVAVGLYSAHWNSFYRWDDEALLFSVIQ